MLDRDYQKNEKIFLVKNKGTQSKSLKWNAKKTKHNFDVCYNSFVVYCKSKQYAALDCCKQAQGQK